MFADTGNFFGVIILTEIGTRNMGLVEHLLPIHTCYHVMPEYDLKKHCNCSKCEFESLFIALKLRNHRLTTGGIYRHPSGNIKHSYLISRIRSNKLKTSIHQLSPV